MRQIMAIAFAAFCGTVLMAQDGVRCSSDDGRRHYCDIDTSRGVRLTRQISGSACVPGSTWGYDRRGVWVDRGCRAEFVSRGGDRERGGNDRFDSDRRGGDRRDYAESVVRCSSDDGRRHYCNIDTSGGVRLTRQISGSPCRQDETWGYDNRGVWVDRGCRAEFTARGRR